MPNSILTATVLLMTFAVVPAAAAQPPNAGYTPEGTIVVSPPAVAPGDDITVTVTGCSPAPGEVDVAIDGVIVGQAQVGPDGSFEQDFGVPPLAEGRVLVEVFCSDEVLTTFVQVRVGPLPFQPQDLPRTGAETQPLLQLAAALVAVGVLFVALGARREERAAPAHARQNPVHAEHPPSRSRRDRTRTGVGT